MDKTSQIVLAVQSILVFFCSELFWPAMAGDRGDIFSAVLWQGNPDGSSPVYDSPFKKISIVFGLLNLLQDIVGWLLILDFGSINLKSVRFLVATPN